MGRRCELSVSSVSKRFLRCSKGIAELGEGGTSTEGELGTPLCARWLGNADFSCDGVAVPFVAEYGFIAPMFLASGVMEAEAGVLPFAPNFAFLASGVAGKPSKLQQTRQ